VYVCHLEVAPEQVKFVDVCVCVCARARVCVCVCVCNHVCVHVRARVLVCVHMCCTCLCKASAVICGCFSDSSLVCNIPVHLQTVRLWDMTNGKEQFQFKMGEPCRACNLSLGEQMLAFTTDAFMGR